IVVQQDVAHRRLGHRAAGDDDPADDAHGTASDCVAIERHVVQGDAGDGVLRSAADAAAQGYRLVRGDGAVAERAAAHFAVADRCRLAIARELDAAGEHRRAEIDRRDQAALHDEAGRTGGNTLPGEVDRAQRASFDQSGGLRRGAPHHREASLEIPPRVAVEAYVLDDASRHVAAVAAALEVPRDAAPAAG